MSSRFDGLKESAYKINYRDLQAVAKKLSLPGNLKHHLLLEVIEARKQGNEDVVRRVLNEQKMERARRKIERLDGKDAAYRGLQMTPERRQLGRPRKNPLPPKPMEDMRPPCLKQRETPLANGDNCLRSLLTMPPPHSIQELLRQAKVPAAPQPESQPMDVRIQRPNYSKQTNIKDGPENFDSVDFARQEVYQPHIMDESILKDYSQMLTREPYLNGSSWNMMNSINSANYIDGWNMPADHCCSFQMKDILANNSSINTSQQYLYSGGDVYTNSTQNEYSGSSQYLQDMLLGGGHDKVMLPYPPPPSSVYPAPQNYWVGVWDEPGANQDFGYWRQYQGSTNPGYRSARNSYYPDVNTGYSPGSDTLSATEQEATDPLATDNNQGGAVELKSGHHFQYPFMYSYAGLTEAQQISQVTGGTGELPLIGGGLMPEERCGDDLYPTFQQQPTSNEKAEVDPLAEVLTDQLTGQ